MLTEKQLGLFRLLDWDPVQEKQIRQRHKDHGGVKDFTRWLTKVLHHRWAEDRRRNTTPYLGD
jgi:hypothetical protein